MPFISSLRSSFGPMSKKQPFRMVEFYAWGAGGGSGSQWRAGTSYHTTTYYQIKEGGAGSLVYARYAITSGISLTLSVGGRGVGGLIQGNPSSATGGYNGGGNGTYNANDASGSGGGYTGVFLNSVGKNQSGALIIAGGGGGGAGGPGYPANDNDQANGGGGIADSTGKGNDGRRNYQFFNAVARGGGLTAGGAGGDASVADGDGLAGSALQGGNGVFYNNTWGSGGGGGGGWFGGGSGANDGNSWSGGGGGAGSSFVRGSGQSYNSSGLISYPGISLQSYTFYTQSWGVQGDGTSTVYGSMRIPVQTGLAQYPGGNISFGGAFNNISPPNGNNGNHGSIVYRIDGGGWTTVSYSGSDITLSI